MGSEEDWKVKFNDKEELVALTEYEIRKFSFWLYCLFQMLQSLSLRTPRSLRKSNHYSIISPNGFPRAKTKKLKIKLTLDCCSCVVDSTLITPPIIGTLLAVIMVLLVLTIVFILIRKRKTGRTMPWVVTQAPLLVDQISFNSISALYLISCKIA